MRRPPCRGSSSESSSSRRPAVRWAAFRWQREGAGGGGLDFVHRGVETHHFVEFLVPLNIVHDHLSTTRSALQPQEAGPLHHRVLNTRNDIITICCLGIGMQFGETQDFVGHVLEFRSAWLHFVDAVMANAVD